MAALLHPLAADFAIELADEGDLGISREILERVDALWAAAQAGNPRLFDGLIFARSSLDTDSAGTVRRLRGRFVRYRFYLAGRTDPAIAAALGLRPVGVSGRLATPAGFVVGRRAQAVVDGGRWELVPSGSIDPSAQRGTAVDAAAILLTELGEEVGIGPAALTGPPVPYAYVEDAETGVDEVAFALDCGLGLAALRAARATTAGEYDDLAVMTAEDYLGLDPAQSIPASRALVRGL